MKCELIEGCLFFNKLDSKAGTALKEVYCLNNPALCARRQVAMAIGREFIPSDLTPNHNHRVQGIIEQVLSGQ
ncbi:MAG: hypothetical protein PHP93_04410 [Kiritimatiellales bacterium]|nr:hypothetical protein [Kiritimatiellales bacterium]